MKYLVSLFLLVVFSSCSSEPVKTSVPEKKKKTIVLLKKINETRSDRIGAGNLFVLANERVVMEFRTKNNKRLAVCRDKDNKYLVYRFGTTKSVELEFPEILDETSFKKFEYSSYLRPGGIENLGMSLDYLSFVNNGYRYVIYKTYAAESVGNEDAVGVRIIDLKTKKETEINGDFKTYSGTFPGEIVNKVNLSEELYD